MTAPRTVPAWIGLGGNLGEVGTAIERALAALAALPGTQVEAHSRLYRSPPWGVLEQPPFVNAVTRIRTGLPAGELLAAMLAIERDAGRRREAEQRWGPRTLDLDLLLYSDASLCLPGLTVPHPRIHQRGFVLVPLAELDADLVVPGQGRVADLLAAMDASAVEALT